MAEGSGQIRWLPLESNPDVMNKYIENLGAESTWSFCDIYGMDPELLMMVPRPVAAVMLLYPITEKSEAEPLGAQEDSSSVYFMKQTVGNACGTVGIIHALANNTDRIKLDESKPLSAFLKSSKDMDRDARADALGKDKNIGWCIADIVKAKAVKKLDTLQQATIAQRARELEQSDCLGAAHESSAKEGQTEAPDISTKTNLHFVAFVHMDGGLYEMDGRKPKPTRHGNTTPDTLLEDTIEVVKKFMGRDPTELSFTLTALAKND